MRDMVKIRVATNSATQTKYQPSFRSPKEKHSTPSVTLLPLGKNLIVISVTGPERNVASGYDSTPRTAQLSRLHSKLAALRDDDEYDDDFLRPTNYAIEKAREWLIETNSKLDGLPPGGHVSTIGDGGVRVEWASDNKRIHLVIASDVLGKTYIYHQEGLVYDVDRNVSSMALSKWLRWL